jgi:U3 small nucleolar RNA-associated protein MPP10
MAALREQILSLEAENVGKKDWVLMGEANSRVRPQNSLLEEDLEFERVMKSVPVVTEESVLGLEEKIKSRILEGRFDDVVRLQLLDDKPFLPAQYPAMDDRKSNQSLAQIYEEEYNRTQTGGDTGNDRDGKLKQEHEQIEKLWEGICGKLDALCNAHFVPKQVTLFLFASHIGINVDCSLKRPYLRLQMFRLRLSSRHCPRLYLPLPCSHLKKSLHRLHPIFGLATS